MAVTSLTVTTDRTNYSYYDPTYSTITVTIAFSPSPATDTLTVTLQRQSQASGARQIPQFGGAAAATASAPIVLSTQTVVLATTASPVTVTFNLKTIKDANGYMLAKHSNYINDYSVVVSNTTNVTGTANLTVLSTTVDEMKNRWLYGAPLIAFEQLLPTIQPQVLTGVTITAVGFNTARGSYALNFTTGASQTLTFGGGNPITIPPAATSMVLFDNSNNNITVSINHSTLPASNTNDTIFLDYKTLDDTQFMRAVIQAYAETQRGMMTKLEPTHIVARNILTFNVGNPTNQDPNTGGTAFIPTTYDEIGDGISFYKQNSVNQWINIELPYTNLLEVYQLQGYFNQGQTVVIPIAWISWSNRNGVIQLVPTNYAILNWILAQAAFYFFFLGSDFIPQFWAYDILAGLREGIPQEVREYLAMYAAVLLLAQVGAARYAAGLTGYSVSRDGVAESQSMIPGIYGYLIQTYERAMGRNPGQPDSMLVRLRSTYNGLWMRSL